jgi:hypothetical protein
MATTKRKAPKGKKPTTLRDLPSKPQRGTAVKGGSSRPGTVVSSSDG